MRLPQRFWIFRWFFVIVSSVMCSWLVSRVLCRIWSLGILLCFWFSVRFQCSFYFFYKLTCKVFSIVACLRSSEMFYVFLPCYPFSIYFDVVRPEFLLFLGEQASCFVFGDLYLSQVSISYYSLVSITAGSAGKQPCSLHFYYFCVLEFW